MKFKNKKQQAVVMSKYNQNRTRQAVDSDLSKRAANTLSNTPENLKKWQGDPRRIDIEGIDTPMIKGESINKIKDNSRLEQEAQEKSTMRINELGNGWIMETEEIYVSRMDTTYPAVMYKVFDPDGNEIKTITEQDKIMPDEVDDEFEDVLRAYTKNREIPYRGTVHEMGYDLESRNMYYLTGETRENKDQIKQAGFTWEPDLKAWSSLHKPAFEINGVDVEMKPTYKTKNAWTYYQ